MKTYNIIKNIVQSQNFKLDDMRAKIKRCYITGDITEEEQLELLALVSENVNPEAERPEWLAVAQTLSERLTALEERITELERKGANDEEETESASGYEKWQAWDGISDKYQYGDIVEHNGVLYQSVFGRQNVWEPGVAGTEALWRVYESDEA